MRRLQDLTAAIAATSFWITLVLAILWGISTRSSPLILLPVMAGLLITSYALSPKQNATVAAIQKLSSDIKTLNHSEPYTSDNIITAIDALPEKIAVSLAAELAKVPTSVATVAIPMSVPMSQGQGHQPTKVVLDAHTWLEAHPEHADKTVRAIAAISGFSKSTIDRAKKLIGE